MTISAGFDAVYEQLIESQRRSARRTGEHIDWMKAGFREIKESSGSLPSLPPASKKAFNALKDSDLKMLLKAYKVKGFTSCKGVRLKKADRVEMCIANNIPPLTFEYLLQYYLSNHN